MKSLPPGTLSKPKGRLARVKVTIDQDFTPSVPVLIPDLETVRDFAQSLHVKNQTWEGIAFGWDAEYRPSTSEPPPDSKMTFTPAEFWIGDATIWGFSMMWEHGDAAPPSESVSDWNVISELESD